MSRLRLIGILLPCVFVLNLADALLTWFWVSRNLATEANPLMAYLLNEGPFWFLLGKMSLVSFGLLLLWKFREARTALPSTLVVFFVYFSILIYHTYGVFLTL